MKQNAGAAGHKKPQGFKTAKGSFEALPDRPSTIDHRPSTIIHIFQIIVSSTRQRTFTYLKKIYMV
jgi:hypothetical protein